MADITGKPEQFVKDQFALLEKYNDLPLEVLVGLLELSKFTMLTKSFTAHQNKGLDNPKIVKANRIP